VLRAPKYVNPALRTFELEKIRLENETKAEAAKAATEAAKENKRMRIQADAAEKAEKLTGADPGISGGGGCRAS